LYVPLGGNREGKPQEVRNIMITMVLGGLWHGASWTFVVWGALQGISVSLVHIARHGLGWTWFDRIPRWVGVLLTFHFVTLAWVFFRAPSLDRAGHVLAAPVLGSWHGFGDYFSDHFFEALLVAVFFTLHRFDDHRRIRIFVAGARREILWPVLVALWAIAITASQGSSAKFIYFDF
jgi:alginate O-acetyltransferase complex protein AlgI